MERTITTRREFLKLAAVASALPFVLNCGTDTSAQGSDSKLLEAIKANANSDPADSYWGARHAPADVRWTTRLSNDTESADRISISGTIYKVDSKTAAANTLVKDGLLLKHDADTMIAQAQSSDILK